MCRRGTRIIILKKASVMLRAGDRVSIFGVYIVLISRDVVLRDLKCWMGKSGRV